MSRQAASWLRRRPHCRSRSAAPRNWDYRYCWLRDSALTLRALMNLGYYDEARAWRDWLLRAIAGSPAQVQILVQHHWRKAVARARTALVGGI